jgi:hypothetical protein
MKMEEISQGAAGKDKSSSRRRQIIQLRNSELHKERQIQKKK